MLTTATSPLEEWTAQRLGVRRLGRPDLERWQLQRLREVVAWARERSPFYHDLYREVPSPLLASLADLPVLPFVEHGVLRDRGAELVCVSLGDIARVVTVPTSGSSGPPKRLWFTEEDLELTADHFRHGMRALMQPGDRLLVLMPGNTPGSVGALLREGLGRDGIEVDSYGFVDDCRAVGDRILEYRAHCLVGVPGQIVRLARSEPGRRIGPGRLRSVLLSGDHVTPAMRKAIEQTWGCRVFEHYGSTELGLGGAVQCAVLAGLHVREADLLFEVVDPVTGETLADGAEGELVATTLTRRGMPLIRYRTGDIVRMAAEPCGCGSVLRCLERVTGRRDDLAELDGGAELGVAELDEAVFSVGQVLGFTAFLDCGPAGDRLTIRVDADEASTRLLEEVGRRVRSLACIRRGSVEVVVEASVDARSLSPCAKQRIVDLRGAASV